MQGDLRLAQEGAQHPMTLTVLQTYFSSAGNINAGEQILPTDADNPHQETNVARVTKEPQAKPDPFRGPSDKPNMVQRFTCRSSRGNSSPNEHVNNYITALSGKLT